MGTFCQWCRPVSDKLAENYSGYFERYRWLIVALCITAAADMASTIYFMSVDGIEHEVHPVIRTLSYVLGPIFGPVLGKAGQLAAIFVVTLYCRRLAVYIFFATSMMYGWAAWYNIWGRELYEPVLLRFLFWA